jgi:(R,R)-butanediol dehydrogenase / meso-butanediol dehydrogenase / diacetyl reductase
MLAVRWHGRGDVRLDEVPAPPAPGPEEVQLRILWCGICGTDVEEWQRGPLFIPAAAPHPLTGQQAPIILGHEFSAVVDSVGARVDGLRPGQRVAADVVVYCGRCRWCRRNKVVRCERMAALGLHADGGLAELCNAPAAMCFPVADSVADDAAALTESLAVGVRALRRGSLAAGERVAVVGAGPVGLMTLQAALALGAERVTVVEPDPSRRALAGQLGAAEGVDPADAAAAGADVAVECAGHPAAVDGALAAVDRGGRVVLVGLDSRAVDLHTFDLVSHEKSLIGSLSHVHDEDFRLAAALLARGAVRAEPVISDRIPLSRAVEDGLQALADEPAEHLKILVSPALT